ncbi:SDR family NAD(P)-dependent oxidoreductase [Mucilaginibacter galii]|uniref:Oxidoreductase n=1 Tax=Mucilaginibacter galii TaxID=2005073 RepID=A0A917N088_9SPHI|nr:SDR family oxidoreductase [Mucilaginibacter galii]GGI49488.1 oxidoreductase [Mucilaginibacter galii]
MNFNGKNILIVGGSSGIGLALVKQLVKDGANIINLSRTSSAEWPDGVKHIEMDVLGDLSSLAAQLPEQLHGLVYAAGSINLKPFTRLTADDFLNDYSINVLGAVTVIQQAHKALRASGAASVVLYSTVATKVGLSFHTSVAAAKSAVNGLTLALAAEFSTQNIRVNAVAPSLTDTPLAGSLLSTDDKREASNKRHPLGRYGQPDDIASATKFLLSDESSWMTGQIISVDGGMSTIK